MTKPYLSPNMVIFIKGPVSGEGAKPLYSHLMLITICFAIFASIVFHSFTEDRNNSVFTEEKVTSNDCPPKPNPASLSLNTPEVCYNCNHDEFIEDYRIHKFNQLLDKHIFAYLLFAGDG